MNNKYSIAIIIPTYNGGELFKKCLKSIDDQDFSFIQKLVIDSSSSDGTPEQAKQFGYEVVVIDKNDFDHGGTRNFALSRITADFVIYMTQDAILEKTNSISNILSAFDNGEVDAVYGRQLPHKDANLLAQHARTNSYTEKSYVTCIDDDNPKGFRKAFMSNSFAAYRVSALRNLGGFPTKLILGEDSYIAAKILMNKRFVAYMAEATVFHSHNYTIKQEFNRYFDIGVFHRKQNWMLDSLGKVEGEGVKFVFGQLKFLVDNRAFHLLFYSIVTSLAKYLGYKLGQKHDNFGNKINRRLSMHKGYFLD
jgi:rhamnosyltransferase